LNDETISVPKKVLAEVINRIKKISEKLEALSRDE